MTYESALAFIHSTNKFGSKLGLDNIKNLLNRLGNPQDALQYVHVAGTNGKGSTCAMISEILMAAGYRVGLYTSPFIEVFEERMRVNGHYIEKEVLADLTNKVKNTIDEMVAAGEPHPTEFEVVTAIGFLYFLEEKCDVVVLEVGLGGRLDATNVIKTPLVSVITPIDLDHVAYLGDTIDLIAFEKAGIIKPDGITVCHPQAALANEVIQKVAYERNNALYMVGSEEGKWLESSFDHCVFEYKGERYELGLIAPYQVNNALTALKTIEALKASHGFRIEDTHVRLGLKKTKWVGRMELVSQSPLVIIDGAHNLHGIEGLCKTIGLWKERYELLAVVGMLEDKDVSGMTKALEEAFTQVIVTQPNIYRAMPSETLAKHFKAFDVLGVHASVPDAMAQAVAWANASPANRLVIAFGSLYMLGDIKRCFH